jgi:NADH-quinone oxidoreductase subunit F
MEKYLSKYFGASDSHTLDHYAERGGYAQARKILSGSLKLEEVTEAVKRSCLRGLGGAGFYTGVKWGFIPKDSKKPRYLVVNADESEPGTFKDRYILTYDPHRLLEGILIASYAIQARKCFIFIRGEYSAQAKRLEAAIKEAYGKGILGKNILGTHLELEVILHRGAGAYICGEESGLLEAVEGKKGFPRLKPPFPAVAGLLGAPTIINNVETLSYLPFIFEMGPERFHKLGCEKSGGIHLVSVSGHVKKPGVYEVPMGIPLKEIIFNFAGGIRNDKKLKAVIPGGISASVLTAEEIDVRMDFDSLKAAGTMMGSSGVVVMDEDTDMVQALLVAARFFAEESCGQCSPCREGTGWITKILKRLVKEEGRAGDIELLLQVAGNMEGNTICAFGDAAAAPVKSYISKFLSEFEAAVSGGVVCRS